MMLQKKLRSTRSFQAEGALSEGITDRFSNLPDEVAHRILSFLTFEDLARVGTVSKRCRKFYVSAPSVNFEVSQARTNQKQVKLTDQMNTKPESALTSYILGEPQYYVLV